MGGAGTANPQDSFSQAYNPATSAWLCPRGDVGLDILLQQKEVEITGNTSSPITSDGHYHSTRGAVFLPSFGFLNRFNECTTYGVTLTPVHFTKTHYEIDIPALGGLTGVHARHDLHVAKLSLHAARVFEGCNVVGFSVDFYAARFKLDGAGALSAAGTTPFTTSKFGKVTDNGYDYSGGISFTVGWMKEICQDLNLGLAYSHEVHLAKFDRYCGFLAKGDLNIPSIVRVGLSYRGFNCWTLAADYELRLWNRIRAMRNSFPDEGAGGTGKGWGFDWKNSWSAKVGAAYEFDQCWTFRLGYRHERLPVRTNSSGSFLNVLIVNTVENVLTSGIGYALSQSTEFNIDFDVGFSHKVKGGIPSQVGAGNYNMQEKFYKIGFSLGHHF